MPRTQLRFFDGLQLEPTLFVVVQVSFLSLLVGLTESMLLPNLRTKSKLKSEPKGERNPADSTASSILGPRVDSLRLRLGLQEDLRSPKSGCLRTTAKLRRLRVPWTRRSQPLPRLNCPMASRMDILSQQIRTPRRQVTMKTKMKTLPTYCPSNSRL